VLHGVKILAGFFNKIPLCPEGIWWVPTGYHQKGKTNTTRILHLAMNALTNYTKKSSQIFTWMGELWTMRS